jgi:hypothetical protein
MTYLDFHATPDERAEIKRLCAEDVMGNGERIADLSVSCYTGTGEDGRPEDVHERRRSDGTCRCGYHALNKYAVTLTRDGSTERVDSFTWGGSRSHAVARVAEQFDRDDMWKGWSFEVSQRPV